MSDSLSVRSARNARAARVKKSARSKSRGSGQTRDPTGDHRGCGASGRGASGHASVLKRKTPLDVLAGTTGADNIRVNTLTRRGYFSNQEVTDEERQHLKPKELKAFFNYLPKTSYWYPYFFIQYFFGCRLSEPALILDEDVNLRKGQILIRRLKKTLEKEGYREHVYALDPRVIECVKAAHVWKEKRKVTDNPFLFASNRQRENGDVGAERLSQLRNLDGWQAVSRFTAHRMFQKIGEAVKLPPNLRHSHVLRHTRAIIMLAEGASVDDVQYCLGHSSLKMTQRYMGIAETMKGHIDAKLLEMGLGR